MSSGTDGPRTGKPPRKAGLVAVARALGVSPSTVSNAYNRPDQLSAALRERVLHTASELGYAGPDPVARSLRSGRAAAVGVVFHDPLAHAFDDPAAVLFLQGFTAGTDAHGLAVVLVPGLPDDEAKGTAVRNAAVDGFVVHGLRADNPLIAATVGRRLPTVVVDAPQLDGVDFVGIDDRAAAAEALRHLLELGHRRLGLLSFLLGDGVDTVARRRFDGCLGALAGSGVAASDLHVEECVLSTVEAGRVGAHALLDRQDCTALFAFSDPLALGAKLAARERGLVRSRGPVDRRLRRHGPRGRGAHEHPPAATRQGPPGGRPPGGGAGRRPAGARSRAAADAPRRGRDDGPAARRLKGTAERAAAVGPCLDHTLS